MNKKIISALPGILILFLIILLLFSCYPSPYRSHIPTASAGQISRDDLITMLEKASSREERERICKNNRKMIAPDFVIKILKKAKESVDVEHLSTDKCVYLANIAVEVSEFTCDKISLAKSLLYRYSNDFSRKKNENPPDLQRALVLFKEVGDKKGEGLCYYRQALNLYHIFKKKDEAFQLLDRAIEIFNKTGETVYEGDCYLAKGEFYRRTGDRDRSIKNCQIAASLYEKSGDVIDVITCYNEMYTACYLKGFLEEALTYLKTEKELIDKSDFTELKDFSDKNSGYFRADRYYNSKDKLLLSYYDSLGSLYYKTGKYEQAIKAYKEAIETGKTIDDTDSIEVLCYWSIGQIYDILGQKDSALKYYLESMGKNTDKSDISMVAFNYLMLGNFYLTELKEPDEALKYYRIALEKSEQIGIPMWRDQYKGLSIKAIGIVYRDKGDPDKAIEYIEKSQDIFREIDKNFAPFGFQIGFNYNTLAKIYQKKGDREKALSCLDKSLEIAQKNNTNISLVYKNYGDFYLESEEFDKALDFYLKAIKLEEERKSVNILEDYYEKTGEIYEKTGKTREAYKYYLKSIDIIEHMRQDMKVEEYKRDFMKDKIEVYEKVIDLLIKIGRHEEAFKYNEKARSRAFLDI
ncbi:MAG: tetratricopeptide repeat protein, partial [Candidatus Eremiobacterota bacterium]